MPHDRRYTRLTKLEVDDLIVNTGATFPGGAQATEGDHTITDGNLIFTAASAKIVPGATSLLIRNTADDATNLGITNAGVVTIRAGLVITAGGILVTAGGLKSAEPTGNGIGYSAGAGGAVTQLTDATTGVTLSKLCGQITTVALTTAAAAEEEFIVTNTTVDATDIIIVSTTYAGGGTPIVSVKAVGADAFTLVITNVHASAALDAVLVVNFAVIKAVAS